MGSWGFNIFGVLRTSRGSSTFWGLRAVRAARSSEAPLKRDLRV